MRRILFLHGPELDKPAGEKVLELCSCYTPLVEPVESNSVYLDLSGCGEFAKIIQAISHLVCHTLHVRLQAGLATSRLLARLAVECQAIHRHPSSFYRVFSRPEIILVEVFPGREGDFISPLPLDSFYPLSHRAVRQFSRLGFNTVGELALLSPAKLAQFSGQQAPMLHRQLNGLDASPVTGLYPPSRIVYPLEMEEAHPNYIQIEQVFRDAASGLAVLLEQKHTGCQRISLEMRAEKAITLKERRLSSPCQESRQLTSILLSLVNSPTLSSPLLGFVITLDELAPMRLDQPDLFTYRLLYKNQERERRLEGLLQNLQTQFPDSLRQGLPIERREQLLALWDPWRCPAGGCRP
ncbi:MAG TPA: hypothetical protein VN426_03280 [Syntrophomonadaceae bacterium]|nr:hypothetical protein [Syntrophomonadaceae bacterium]